MRYAAIGLSLLAAALLLACGIKERRPEQAMTANELYLHHDTVWQHADDYSDTIEIHYAKGLSVSYESDGIHIAISNPDPAAASGRVEAFVMTKPASRFICTTALQVGNFEVLGLEDRIVGMNSLRNLFSPQVKAQMAEGRTVRIGKEGNFDLETVIAARPDYIFVSASKHGGFEALKECGIPLLSHHGYKETDPLGQAEWIKLIGLLTGETRRANAVFADIERKYLTLRDEVARLDSISRPTVISGRQIRDGWYIAGGRSYLAQLFHDAGARYIMADNEDSGGTTLDFEAVFARGLNADFWQTDGSFDGDFTLQTLADEDPRYVSMRAWKEGHVLFCNLTRKPYRELAGVQPHLLLADFVKAFHPELLPDYHPSYYEIIK